MNADNQKVVKPDESQNPEQTVDKSRRALTKAGGIAPIVMTLASKTALGAAYQCSISGMQSGNASSHATDVSVCRAGYSVDQWAGVDSASSNPDINDWIAAGINPFRVEKKGSNYFYQKSGVCSGPAAGNALTMCQAIFASLAFPIASSNPGVCTTGNVDYIDATTFLSVFGSGPSTLSFWDALKSSDITRDASVDYLNAKLGLIPDISPQDIIDLYKLAAFGTSFLHGSMFISNQASAATLLINLHP